MLPYILNRPRTLNIIGGRKIIPLAKFLEALIKLTNIEKEQIRYN
jgi:hypothetical protein